MASVEFATCGLHAASATNQGRTRHSRQSRRTFRPSKVVYKDENNVRRLGSRGHSTSGGRGCNDARAKRQEASRHGVCLRVCVWVCAYARPRWCVAAQSLRLEPAVDDEKDTVLAAGGRKPTENNERLEDRLAIHRWGRPCYRYGHTPLFNCYNACPCMMVWP